MQHAIGEYIRQMRRQRSLTQTDLGGERFSKSYVSAVERDKIVPSREALLFFAEQLEQPVDYFEQLFQQSEQMRQISPYPTGPHFYNKNDPGEQDEVMALLDLVLEGRELRHTPLSQEITTFPQDMMISLPLQVQARYYFLKGLIAQEDGDLESARQALESALAFSSEKHQPAILDTLGVNHYLTQTYQTALGYHIRALRILDRGVANGKTPALRLNVELHCGNAYRALGANAIACEHYERARQYLRSSHNMKVAGQVYLGLGYCTYASLYQEGVPSHNAAERLSSEEKERLFQRAVSFFLQSRTIYQVSSDRMGEANARLLHAMVLLDFCNLRRQIALERAQGAKTVVPMQCGSLLDEAEEQCRQILVPWSEVSSEASSPSPELEVVLYAALSYLVRVLVQRAAVARLEGYSDTAIRERSRAAHLCQLVLNTLTTREIPWSLIQDAVHLPEDPAAYSFQALPRLPDLAESTSFRALMSLTEVYFAAAEVAEELGRTATTSTFAYDSYVCANQCFQASLNMERQIIPSKEYDLSYLTRSYQRCIAILEERIHVAPAMVEETYQIMLAILKDGLSYLQYPTRFCT